MNHVNLGDKVRDRISGLEGVVTGISTFITGCRHICINPQELKDGKPVGSTWMDEPRLEVIEAGVFKVDPDAPVPMKSPNPHGGPFTETPPPTK